MKGKILTGLIVALAVSSNGMAAELNKSELISQNVTTTGKFAATFKDINKDTLKNFLANAKKRHSREGADNVLTNTYMFETSGVVNQKIELFGSSTISILNDTIQDHNYTVETTICDGQNLCSSESLTFLIHPNGSVSLSKQVTLNSTYPSAGSYEDYVYLDVQRDDDETVFTNVGGGVVTITDSNKK